MLRKTLERLAGLKRTPFPFISVYVDLTPELEGSYTSSGGAEDKAPLKSWRRTDEPDHRHYRPGITRLYALLSEKSKLMGVRGPERDSFDADVQRLHSYLDAELDTSANGLAIFACDHEGIWEVEELPVSVETQVFIDHGPTVHPLALVEDTYDRYALCLADSQSARVWVVAMGRVQHEESIDGPTVNYKMTGGWSQKRIQERITNVVSEHIRSVAQRLEEIVFTEDIPWIVLGGDEIVQTEFKKHLSDRAWQRVVEVNRLDTKLPAHEAIAESVDAVIKAEHEEGLDLARRALDATLSNNLGAAGEQAVSHALSLGAVETLILDKRFESEGWRCMDDPSQVGGSGQPDDCPVGPGPAETVDLKEAFVKLALQTGAQVEFVDNSEDLERLGHVAALLRWRPADLPPSAGTVV